ncbi:MAG: hypothetical protein M1827_004861 [Pycnora praestabilis]|nr:MAG: hypothetical protein M1827_004861 [Pycnora praestabilis]
MAMTGGGQEQGMHRPANIQVLQSIIQVLRQQNSLPGWQSAVSEQERGMKIIQLVSSLRLIRPNMVIREAMEVAIKFERNEFEQGADKASYETKCRDKLNQITETRMKRAAQMQQPQNAQNPAMNIMQSAQMQGTVSNQGENQFQQGFPHHLQQQMQASQIPMMPQPQAQMTMGMENHSLPAQVAQSNQFPPNMRPQQQQPPSQRVQEAFTAQEHEQINMMAASIADNTPPEDLARIRTNLANISQAQRDTLAKQGIEPLMYFFRSQAIRQFSARKQKMQQAQQFPQQQGGPGMITQIGGQAGGARPNPANVVPGQQRSVSQAPMGGQGQPQGVTGGPQNFDSWMGSVGNFIDQQADALRSQEAGQLVVPVSNNQRMAQQQMNGIPGQMNQASTPQPGQVAGRPTLNPNVTAQQQQQYLNAHQAQQEKLQQAAQIQAQSQVQAQARANAQAKANQIALQGQPGGINAQAGQRLPQQSPAMSMLNRPLAPPGQQPPGQGTPQQKSQQGTPQMAQQLGQKPDPRFAQLSAQQLQQQRAVAAQNAQGQMSQQRPQIPSNMPIQVRNQIVNLPDDQLRQILAKWQHSVQNQANRQGMPAGSMAPQTQMPQSGIQVPPQGFQPGQQLNPQQFGAPAPGFPQRPPSAQQVSGNMSIQPTPQQLQQQQAMLRQQDNRVAYQRQQAAQVAMQAMTPERIREMDTKDFPRSILNAQNNNTISQVPEQVKTWSQLKEWVARNPGHMPPGSLDKLKNLQSLHYQNIQNPGQRPMAQRGAPGPIPPGTMVQQQAPAAMMVPQGIQNQIPPQANMQRPFFQQMSQGMIMQQPSAREIQVWRQRLGDRAKNMGDDQIKGFIIQMRQRQAMAQATNGAQGQPAAAQQAPQQAAQQTALQKAQQEQAQQQQQRQVSQGAKVAPTRQIQQPQRGPQQSQPTPEIKTGKVQPVSKATRPAMDNRGVAQPSTPAMQSNKGIKRASSDDVVEVPDPSKQPVQQPQVPTAQQTQGQPRPDIFSITPQQLASMPPQQRAKVEAARERTLAQNNTMRQATEQVPPVRPPMGTTDSAALEKQKEENAKRNARLKVIVAEVFHNTPKRTPIDVTFEVKEAMTQKLRTSKEMISRMETSLPLFFATYGDEKTTRDLISARLQLVQQFRDKNLENINDKFSITLEEMEASLLKMRKYFTFIMHKMVQNQQIKVGQNQPAPQQPLDQQGPPAQTSEGQKHPLSSANLQQQQQALQAARRTTMQRNNSRNEHVPAAPTSSQPPFPLGASSPHGVPFYARNELTQDKLKFPPAKKRKGNQPGSADSTPAQALNTPASTTSPQLQKLSSPESKKSSAIDSNKAAVEATPLYKCPINDCEHYSKGFASSAELAKHKTAFHEVRQPPIEDPLKYALETLALGVGLNKDGSKKESKQEVNATTKGMLTATSQKVQSSPSRLGQGQTPKPKPEPFTPAGGIDTPMGRPLTQSGYKNESPASNMLKTPQVTNVKTPGSGASGMRNMLSKAAKDTNARAPSDQPNGVTEIPPSPSAWGESAISQEALLQCFEGLESLQGIGSFTSTQTLSPARSTPSSKESEESTHESDISEHDDLRINIAGGFDSNWNPANPFDGGITKDLDNLDMGVGEFDIDWNDSFGAEEGFDVSLFSIRC